MPAIKKRLLRSQMKEKRDSLFRENPQAGEEATRLFFSSSLGLKSKDIVGVYWSIGSEFDTRPFLKACAEKGIPCALPRVTTQGLEFHLWTPGMPMEKGEFGIEEPPEEAPKVTPAVLLIPCLAFDRKGHRLGYGKGHYDHYLHHHKVLAIGLAFQGQEREQLPYELHDIPLDYIVTEKEIIHPILPRTQTL